MENVRCSRSVAAALRVLERIILNHPASSENLPGFPSAPIVTGPDGDSPEPTSTGGTKEEGGGEENEPSQIVEQKSDDVVSFQRNSTRSELIQSLNNRHYIMELFFQDLSRYMHEDDTLSDGGGDQKMTDVSDRRPRGPPPPPTRKINNFQARFDFLKFILSNSPLQLNRTQIDQLWDVVIGDKLDKDSHNIPYFSQLELQHFFRWLRNICPKLQTHMDISANAITLQDACYLFHEKLSHMPRKTMSTDC